MTFFSNFHTDRLIAAHRGFRAHHPENTLSAFLSSRGRCHFIELDVQMSKDLVPVVYHDSTLERTSNVKTQGEKTGIRSVKVRDWLHSQLKTLDIGSWYIDADPFGAISNNDISIISLRKEMPQTIMTLEEILLHPSLNKLPINIEIKDQQGKKQNERVTENVLEVIRATGSVDRVLISSFNHDYLVTAKHRAPEVSTAALKSGSHPKNLVAYLRDLQVEAYHPADNITDASLINKLRDAGMRVNVYTVNSKTRQQQLFAMGVTSVFTDFPQLS